MMLRALKPLVYNGHNIAAGEVFRLQQSASTDAERRILLTTGLAADVDDQADDPPKKRSYKRRDLQAEE